MRVYGGGAVETEANSLKVPYDDASELLKIHFTALKGTFYFAESNEYQWDQEQILKKNFKNHFNII